VTLGTLPATVISRAVVTGFAVGVPGVVKDHAHPYTRVVALGALPRPVAGRGIMAVGAGVVGFMCVRRGPRRSIVAQQTVARIVVRGSGVTGCAGCVAGVVEVHQCPIGSTVASVAISRIVSAWGSMALAASGNPRVVEGDR